MFGGEVCRRFLTTFDYTHRRVILRRGAHYTDPFPFDSSGVELRYSKAGFEVHFVMANSRAEKAGVEKGDLITSIDGVSTRKINFQSALTMFRRSGQTFRLMVKRGAEVRQIQLTTKRIL